MGTYVIKPPPAEYKVDIDLQGISKPWREYFDESNRQLGYSIRKKYNTVSSYTGDTTLNASDFGNIVKVTCNTPANITLPTITAELVDSWVTILRLGKADIRITAPASAAIERSGLGGSLVCSESARLGANLQLFAASTTLYVILGGTGIWSVMGLNLV